VEAGRQVTVLDNLVTGRRDRTRWGRFHRGDIRDVETVRDLIRSNGVTTVIHLAASAHVGESIAHPAQYFSNNVSGTVALLEAMLAENVRRMVFASSCSVYGNATSLRIGEDDDAHPVSPYGESKLFAERALAWYGRAYDLQSVSLRYFNVAGADPEADLGEDTATSRRIVPRAFRAAQGMDGSFSVFGTDFETADGTAVRDYVHARDIAEANLRAIEYLEADEPSIVLNLGTGTGLSVRQVIEEVGKALGRRVPVQESPRRLGDVPYAVADASRAAAVLGWHPTRSTLAEIVHSVAARHSATAAQSLAAER